MPNAMGGSPPHEPFFGPHSHPHDHSSHAHPHSRPDHGHVHADASGKPIIDDDGFAGHLPVGAPAGLSAGYPGASVRGQHHHPAHSHLHHHGHFSGLAESSHAHHHAEAPPELEMPGGDVYKIPGEMGGGMASPADSEVARIAAQHPYEGFTGGMVKSRSYVYTEPNDKGATDHRQPRLGNVIHPGVAEVLARNREVFEPAGPLTELKQQRSRTLLGPLGREGRAHVRRPQGKAGEHPATR
jgi:hypothetical protein